MKLVTFRVHTEDRLGARVGDVIVDLNSAYALMLKEKGEEFPKRQANAILPPNMLGFLEGGDKSKRTAEDVLNWLKSKPKELKGLDGESIVLGSEARLLAPIPRPGKLYCAAVNYYDHATERLASDPAAREKEINRLKSLKLTVPDCFQKQPSLVVGPNDPIIKPKVSDKLDYENELAVVIGKRGKDIPLDKVYDHIAGYTIMIDVSFRDQGFPQDVDFRFYKYDVNWTKGKGMDNAAPMGPCIVTSDEIKDPYNPPLKLLTRVNGQTRQNGSVSDMIIGIPYLVSYLSKGTTLNPGDVIMTGTCAGVAGSWGPEGYLKPGDDVEIEIQPIGVLKHKVISDPWYEK